MFSNFKLTYNAKIKAEKFADVKLIWAQKCGIKYAKRQADVSH